MMEEYCPDIVQMAIQREQTPPCLITPHLDLVVITTGHEEGLGRVEVNGSNGAIMLFESIDEGTHAVIPQLDGARM